MHRVSVREQTHGNNNKWESLSLNKIVIILLYIFPYLIHNYTFFIFKNTLLETFHQIHCLHYEYFKYMFLKYNFYIILNNNI